MVVLITVGLFSKLSEMMHPPTLEYQMNFSKHTGTHTRVNFGAFLSPNHFAEATPCLTSEQSITKATRDHQSWGMLEV